VRDVLRRRFVWKPSSFDNLIDRFEASSEPRHEYLHTCCRETGTNEILLVGFIVILESEISGSLAPLGRFLLANHWETNAIINAEHPYHSTMSRQTRPSVGSSTIGFEKNKSIEETIINISMLSYACLL
jgi:hypothetical protein